MERLPPAGTHRRVPLPDHSQQLPWFRHLGAWLTSLHPGQVYHFPCLNCANARLRTTAAITHPLARRPGAVCPQGPISTHRGGSI
jgi:hypothetical protein